MKKLLLLWAGPGAVFSSGGMEEFAHGTRHRDIEGAFTVTGISQSALPGPPVPKSSSLLLAAVWAVFGQARGFEFVNSDDDEYVCANPVVRHGLTRHGLAGVSAAAVRDGRRALVLAAEAVKRSGGKDAAILDTLAAAQAECGQFSGAVETARRTLDLARSRGGDGPANAVRSRLQRYERQRSFHENAPAR